MTINFSDVSVDMRFQLDNGVKLLMHGYARCIRSSNRIDARIISIDWKTIYTSLSLDIPQESSLQHVQLIHACLDDDDAESYLDEQVQELAAVLGSPGSAEKIKQAFLTAREKVLTKKREA
jgi:hypothetical protein